MGFGGKNYTPFWVIALTLVGWLVMSLMSDYAYILLIVLLAFGFYQFSVLISPKDNSRFNISDPKKTSIVKDKPFEIDLETKGKEERSKPKSIKINVTFFIQNDGSFMTSKSRNLEGQTKFVVPSKYSDQIIIVVNAGGFYKYTAKELLSSINTNGFFKFEGGEINNVYSLNTTNDEKLFQSRYLFLISKMGFLLKLKIFDLLCDSFDDKVAIQLLDNDFLVSSCLVQENQYFVISTYLGYIIKLNETFIECDIKTKCIQLRGEQDFITSWTTLQSDKSSILTIIENGYYLLCEEKNFRPMKDGLEGVLNFPFDKVYGLNNNVLNVAENDYVSVTTQNGRNIMLLVSDLEKTNRGATPIKISEIESKDKIVSVLKI